MQAEQGDVLTNALSSMPTMQRGNDSQNTVDFNSNSFYDPSIKITIQVLHEVGQVPEGTRSVAQDGSQRGALDTVSLSAEKREQLETILSSIDSPLDGSQSIQGSGLFKPRRKSQKPSKRKNKGKHHKKKHRIEAKPLTEGMCPVSTTRH